MASETFADELRAAVAGDKFTLYTELMLQAAELLDHKDEQINTRPAPVDANPLASNTVDDKIAPDTDGNASAATDTGESEIRKVRKDAEELLAAKDADTDRVLADNRRCLVRIAELEADNAAKDARIKALEVELENGGRVKGVNTQYANALAYLEMTEDDDPEEFAKRIWDEREALEAKLAAAEKALEPFALVAEHDIGEDESDNDLFRPLTLFNRVPRIRVGHLRAARAVLGWEPS